MASLLKNIAEPYNKDKVYNTKDMVLYNNLLYLCIYNNVSGEFNSSKWIEVQLTDLVQGKLRGIEDYSGKVIDASYVEQDDDYTYFGVPQKAFVDNETSFRTLSSNLNSSLIVKGTVYGFNMKLPANSCLLFVFPAYTGAGGGITQITDMTLVHSKSYAGYNQDGGSGSTSIHVYETGDNPTATVMSGGVSTLMFTFPAGYSENISF